ncbi:hypothetical protein [Chlamydia sp.]|uniref:hypothetical protein n=1 Tax=Chlamydia sp. TaxID=35827 RepID=UPI0025BE6C93|nr:hypothetical protein [Chlamydia sp.]MBQ8498618.1 hypothetical protein [Chlamydia sp.]
MFEFLRKKVSSYSVVLFCLVALAVALSTKIVINIRACQAERQYSLALLSRAAAAAHSRGVFPPDTAMPILEQAYRRAGRDAASYAGFLASCFYLHKDPLRGAYYSGLAYDYGVHLRLPSPQQALLKEIADAHATQQYQIVLDKSRDLLSLISHSQDFPMLHFLTLLRIIEVKESLNQDVSLELEELRSLPRFNDYEQFYKEGVWTISKRYDSSATAH